MNGQLNITKGNDFGLRICLMRDGSAYPADTAKELTVHLVGYAGKVLCENVMQEDGAIMVSVSGDDVSTGSWGVEVCGETDGVKWRTYATDVLKITYATEAGGLRTVYMNTDCYDIGMQVSLAEPRCTVPAGGSGDGDGENDVSDNGSSDEKGCDCKEWGNWRYATNEDIDKMFEE